MALALGESGGKKTLGKFEQLKIAPREFGRTTLVIFLVENIWLSCRYEESRTDQRSLCPEGSHPLSLHLSDFEPPKLGFLSYLRVAQLVQGASSDPYRICDDLYLSIYLSIYIYVYIYVRIFTMCIYIYTYSNM